MVDKRTIIAGAGATLTLIIVIFTSILLTAERPISHAAAAVSHVELSSAVVAEPSAEPFTEKTSTAAHTFILREYNGGIGVFESAEDIPFITLDVPISALRTTDADRLRSGITVEGELELARLIEDFDS